MGFSPTEVERMSLWQFQAAAVGWVKAQGGEVQSEWTDAEFEAAIAAGDAFPDRTT